MYEDIFVRKLMSSDVDRFFDLRLESLQNNPSSFLSSYEEEKNAGPGFFDNILAMDDAKNVIFGAFINDGMVGILGVYRENMGQAAHKCNLWGMYVQPAYRKHGIGKKLIETAIKHAKEVMRCSIANITVETTNVVAKNLYEGCGFKIWGVETNAMCVNGAFNDEFHMSLFL